MPQSTSPARSAIGRPEPTGAPPGRSAMRRLADVGRLTVSPTMCCRRWKSNRGRRWTTHGRRSRSRRAVDQTGEALIHLIPRERRTAYPPRAARGFRPTSASCPGREAARLCIARQSSASSSRFARDRASKHRWNVKLSPRELARPASTAPRRLRRSR